MPRASSPPSPPRTHTASTSRRAVLPPALTRASDGGITDPELERRWASVKARLSAVLDEVKRTKHPVKTDPRDWVTMYSDVASLYMQDDGVRKRRMYLYVREFVRDLVATQLNHLMTLKGDTLLKEYCRTWDASLTFVGFMKRVLHHLHRYWIADNANTLKDDPVRPLDKLLMFYWREDLLSNLHSVIDIALEMVDKDRRGESIDHDVVRGVVDTLVEVGGADISMPEADSTADEQASANLSKLHLYIRVFEDDFLELTRAFYKAEGAKMVAVGDVTRFMKSVLARLEEEDQRGRRLLHSDSWKRLRQATEEQLIGNHKEYLQNAATEMIKQGREEDLKLLYTLLSKVENGLNPLRSFFVGFVREEGNALVVKHVDKMNGKDDMESNLGLVRILVRLYRKHASLIKRCFNGSQVIMLGVDDAFRGFANRSVGSLSLPNLMAHYVDHLLRRGRAFDRDMWEIPTLKESSTTDASNNSNEDSEKPAIGSSPTSDSPLKERPRKRQRTDSGLKEANEEDAKKDAEDEALSKYMSELVRIFMFLDDKDLFSETHRRLFAKRLLATHDEELEERFIEKLKVEMGPTYTQRLSGMLKDKLVSNTLRSEFVQHLKKKREEREAFLRDMREVENSKRAAAIIALTKLRQDTSGGIDLLIEKVQSSALFRKQKKDADNDENVQTNGNAVESEEAEVSGQPQPASGTAAGTNTNRKGDDEQSKPSKSSKIDISDTLVGEALKIDFNSHVLNALHWPSVKVASLRVPPVLAACQSLFSEFYMTDKETRKLSWIHTLSTVHLGANFGSRRYTLVVSTFQACALLLFSKRDSILVRDACAELNISVKELHQHIKPLIIGKRSKLLRIEKKAAKDVETEDDSPAEVEEVQKSDESNESDIQPANPNPSEQNEARSQEPATDNVSPRAMIEADASLLIQVSKPNAPSGVDKTDNSSDGNRNDNLKTNSTDSGESGNKENTSDSDEEDKLQEADEIHLNLDFRSKLHRVVVPATMMKLGSGEAVVNKRNVVVDRSTQIDAALVRILKARKEVFYADLIAQVVSALSSMFLPDPRMIKSRLERLIDQEYVERDSTDPRLYRYSA